MFGLFKPSTPTAGAATKERRRQRGPRVETDVEFVAMGNKKKLTGRAMANTTKKCPNHCSLERNLGGTQQTYSGYRGTDTEGKEETGVDSRLP